MQTHKHDPFMTGTWGGRPIGAVTAGDRLSMVKGFSLQEIDQALQLDHIQKSVRAALQRRRRQILREQVGNRMEGC
jgi:hypothetical protein